MLQIQTSHKRQHEGVPPTARLRRARQPAEAPCPPPGPLPRAVQRASGAGGGPSFRDGLCLLLHGHHWRHRPRPLSPGPRLPHGPFRRGHRRGQRGPGARQHHRPLRKFLDAAGRRQGPSDARHASRAPRDHDCDGAAHPQLLAGLARRFRVRAPGGPEIATLKLTMNVRKALL